MQLSGCGGCLTSLARYHTGTAAVRDAGMANNCGLCFTVGLGGGGVLELKPGLERRGELPLQQQTRFTDVKTCVVGGGGNSLVKSSIWHLRSGPAIVGEAKNHSGNQNQHGEDLQQIS